MMSVKACAHDWESVGAKRLEPRRWWFGKRKVWRSARCCGVPMAQAEERSVRRCKKGCGRWEESVVNDCIALCHVCGQHRIHPDA